MALELDASAFPFVRGTFPPDCDLGLSQLLTEALDELIDRAEAESSVVIVVFDTRQITRVDAVARKHYAGWESELSEDRFARFGARVAIVQSALIRGSLTAIGWFSPRVRDIGVAQDPVEAMQILRERHAAGRLDVTERQLDIFENQMLMDEAATA